MRTRTNLIVAGVFLAVVCCAAGEAHYVDLNSPNPTPPYTNWATAATVIQDAVDAAAAGDEIVVTNGVYFTGGRHAINSALMNRVIADKPLALRSVNGPQFTIIQGYQVPGTINGDGAIRCVYLTNGASMSGFTLTNGATRRFDVGMYSVDHCGGGVFSESETSMVFNCVLAGNSAFFVGGGAYGGALKNCVLSHNSAGGSGGGAGGDAFPNAPTPYTLNNCSLKCNWAYYGGGAAGATLNNCTLTGNSALRGGGTAWGTLNNCTLTGNSANGSIYSSGGGAYASTLNNCIVYFNAAPHEGNYDSTSTLNYCCTTPQPPNGLGNLSLDPQLASASHLSGTSPCRGTGSALHATGVDVDGEAWAAPPSIGCDEYAVGAVVGPLSVAIAAPFTYAVTNYPIHLAGLVEGRSTASVWDFGDGTFATNQPYVTHAWTASGDFALALRAYNESQPAGISSTVTVHVVAQTVHYVAEGSTNPKAPYIAWATAARSIQDAVDRAEVGSEIVVTNGTYSTGGRAVYGTMTNRVAVDKPLRLSSANGPEFTIIQGYQMPGTTNGDDATRCVYLADGAKLSGFTLTNGATRTAGDWDREQSDGGVWCESIGAVVSDCVLIDNSAHFGGGAYGGTLNNCTVTGNWAYYGGGASGCVLSACTLSNNSGTAAVECALTNCTLEGNLGSGVVNCTADNCALSGNSDAGAASSMLNDCTLDGNSAGAIECTLNHCTLSRNGVTNGGGDYGGGASGSTLNNCVLTGNSATLLGGGAYDCMLNNCTLTSNSAYQGGGASDSTLMNCTLSQNSAPLGHGGGVSSCTLSNCTLTANSSYGSGGGASGSTLNNCMLRGNSANGPWTFNGPHGSGGGASGSTLNNCVLTGNSATVWGGGAYACRLNNCTLTVNSANGNPRGGGGGAVGGKLNNCIVYFNTGTNGANFNQDYSLGGISSYFLSTLFNYCCTTPQPTNGFGNITNAPFFVEEAGGNLRLQSNSPCINSGNNTYAPTGPDLDGNPRNFGGTVDIGAYEFETPTSLLSYAWLQTYGLQTDGSADFTDPDNDGMNNWQEWRCLTDPTNALSALRLLAPSITSTNVTLTWQSMVGVNYFLERSTNLVSAPIFAPLATGIAGQPGTISYTDSNFPGPGPSFYRIGVGN